MKICQGRMRGNSQTGFCKLKVADDNKGTGWWQWVRRKEPRKEKR